MSQSERSAPPDLFPLGHAARRPARYPNVMTAHFPSAFGMETLRDLPAIEALEDAASPTERPRKRSGFQPRLKAMMNKATAALHDLSYKILRGSHDVVVKRSITS